MGAVHDDTSELKDEDLVSQTLLGNHEAYGFLVLKYSKAVRSVCLARLGNAQDLDDLVQDCFVRAWNGLKRLKEHSHYSHYLRRIARNICIDQLRKRGQEQLSLDEIELDPTDNSPAPGEAAVEEDDRLPRLRQAVGGLPEALREAIFMFYFENLSLKQMSEQLEITEASVSQRLGRARQRMRERLDKGSRKR